MMTKTRRRRLVPIPDNLRAWIEPLSQPEGPIVVHRALSNALLNHAARNKLKWKRNALRHSFISYKLALVPDTARVALECGNSPETIFAHYRELVSPQQATEWLKATEELASEPEATTNATNSDPSTVAADV